MCGSDTFTTVVRALHEGGEHHRHGDEPWIDGLVLCHRKAGRQKGRRAGVEAAGQEGRRQGRRQGARSCLPALRLEFLPSAICLLALSVIGINRRVHRHARTEQVLGILTGSRTILTGSAARPSRSCRSRSPAQQAEARAVAPAMLSILRRNSRPPSASTSAFARWPGRTFCNCVSL